MRLWKLSSSRTLLREKSNKDGEKSDIHYISNRCVRTVFFNSVLISRTGKNYFFSAINLHFAFQRYLGSNIHDSINFDLLLYLQVIYLLHLIMRKPSHRFSEISYILTYLIRLTSSSPFIRGHTGNYRSPLITIRCNFSALIKNSKIFFHSLFPGLFGLPRGLLPGATTDFTLPYASLSLLLTIWPYQSNLLRFITISKYNKLHFSKSSLVVNLSLSRTPHILLSILLSHLTKISSNYRVAAQVLDP